MYKMCVCRSRGGDPNARQFGWHWWLAYGRTRVPCFQTNPCSKPKTIGSGWWFEPLWKILVNWDDYSQYMGKWKMFQTTNQTIGCEFCRLQLILVLTNDWRLSQHPLWHARLHFNTCYSFLFIPIHSCPFLFHSCFISTSPSVSKVFLNICLSSLGVSSTLVFLAFLAFLALTLRRACESWEDFLYLYKFDV